MQVLLAEALNLTSQVIEIVPLRHHNARVYSLDISPATKTTPILQPKPGVLALPSETTKLIMRFSDPASMLNEEIRVQNEVAIMLLAREALSPLRPSIVPDVYGWSPFSEGKGWTLIEFKEGVPLGDKLPDLDFEKKRDILRQIAQIFKLIQSFTLPDSITTYGGVGFSEDGAFTGSSTPIAGGGPCNTLSDLYAEYFQMQIGFADKCDIVQGWKNSELRSRLEAFGAEGLKSLVEKLSARPTLVHGDFGKSSNLFQ